MAGHFDVDVLYPPDPLKNDDEDEDGEGKSMGWHAFQKAVHKNCDKYLKKRGHLKIRNRIHGEAASKLLIKSKKERTCPPGFAKDW